MIVFVTLTAVVVTPTLACARPIVVLVFETAASHTLALMATCRRVLA